MVSTKYNPFLKLTDHINWWFIDPFPKEVLIVSVVTSIFIITVFLVIVATGIIVLVLVHQKKQLQYLREKEQLKVAFEKEILESKLEIQEQTLKNVSQEIHDNIGQILILVKLTLNTIHSDENLFLQEKIDNSQQLLGKAIQDLRDLSKSLNSDTISEMGLVKAIEYEFELIKKAGNYRTILTEEGDFFQLSHQHELILFRILQETINNILKHSNASVVTVDIRYNPGNFSLKISDNGKGFDLAALNADNNTGSGIRNIQNRARLIGADVSIQSQQGTGTTVDITLPYKPANKSA